MNFRVYLEEHPSHINIITDKEISRGGCQITVGDTHIDATIENRWKRSIYPLGIEDEWHDPNSAENHYERENSHNDDESDESDENDANNENAENAENANNAANANNANNAN